MLGWIFHLLNAEDYKKVLTLIRHGRHKIRIILNAYKLIQRPRLTAREKVHNLSIASYNTSKAG